MLPGAPAAGALAAASAGAGRSAAAPAPAPGAAGPGLDPPGAQAMNRSSSAARPSVRHPREQVVRMPPPFSGHARGGTRWGDPSVTQRLLAASSLALSAYGASARMGL